MDFILKGIENLLGGIVGGLGSGLESLFGELFGGGAKKPRYRSTPKAEVSSPLGAFAPSPGPARAKPVRKAKAACKT